ncbi:MAG TPA: helix-turn-helix transcriptional regulator [Propionicimonas sp.]|uniref:helix-turn-helix transcriptional regulator n=1 Tax=Propionicimonas sp. TaxID=1955623 RepID=UPI002F3F8521
MDERDEVREFLSSRRARLSPADVGLPQRSGRRRVAGLRRDEVAVLAGVSTEYYARLERGQLAGVSDAVLDSLANALRLDEAERLHLHLRNLASAARTPARRRRPSTKTETVRASVQQVLDALVTAPAYVYNSRVDIIASNALARAVLSPVFDFAESTASLPNTARYAFLDPSGSRFYPDWERVSRGVVAALHVAVGRNPFDKPLTDLIGELSSRSDVFRTLWATQDVWLHLTGSKVLRHPEMGLLELDYEVLPLPGEGQLSLVVYSAARGTPAADSLALLGSLIAGQYESATPVQRTSPPDPVG